MRWLWDRSQILQLFAAQLGEFTQWSVVELRALPGSAHPLFGASLSKHAG